MIRLKNLLTEQTKTYTTKMDVGLGKRGHDFKLKQGAEFQEAHGEKYKAVCWLSDSDGIRTDLISNFDWFWGIPVDTDPTLPGTPKSSGEATHVHIEFYCKPYVHPLASYPGWTGDPERKDMNAPGKNPYGDQTPARLFVVYAGPEIKMRADAVYHNALEKHLFDTFCR